VICRVMEGHWRSAPSDQPSRTPIQQLWCADWVSSHVALKYSTATGQPRVNMASKDA
jgi:hypothetical protein